MTDKIDVPFAIQALPKGEYTEMVIPLGVDYQTSNDLSFSGTCDSPDMPVKIEQKSGLNGEGMDVTVTTSSFYFPTN